MKSPLRAWRDERRYRAMTTKMVAYMGENEMPQEMRGIYGVTFKTPFWRAVWQRIKL